MIRTTCCVCDAATLIPFYCQKQFPLLSIPTTLPPENDTYYDFNFSICNSCKCVQLTTLINPTILYSMDNKNSLISQLWRDHHRSFANFINSHNTDTTICEIGGGSNPFYTYLQNIKTYNILDIYEPLEKQPNISYILGNCETFTDYTDNTLIMSHTFEHLYNPRQFLNSLQKSTVQHIYISVPNMRTWLEQKISVYIVFNQHTYYFEKEDIISLFSQFGFYCSDSKLFKEHSLFFYFTRVNNTPVYDIPVKNSEMLLYNHFTSKEKSIGACSTTKNVFIMPSFYIGQIVYYYLNKSINIVGFLDNDSNKVDKRLYGTPLLTYLPNEILKHDPINTAILIVQTPYYAEMCSQIQHISPNIEIITIEF